MNIKSLLKFLRCVSIWKTLYFNLNVFSFKKALSLPVLVGKCVVLKNIGVLLFENHGIRLHLGTQQLFNTCNKLPLIWDNKGRISLRGGVVIQPGACIHVSKYGHLILEGRNYIGTQSLLVCHRNVTIGYNTQFSWNCQLSDTDFHFIKNLDSGEIKDNCNPINIGPNVWIGNHVIISKGVSIADGCIVGMNSFVNKSITKSNTISIGSPARTLEGKYERVWDSETEHELSHQYR